MYRMLSIGLLFVLIGCGMNTPVEEETQTTEENEVHSEKEAEKPEIPEDSSMKNELENQKKLEGFMQKVKKGTPDEVRIVRYTVEGDSIYTDLAFNGQSIKFKRDTRRDKQGNGQVIERTCQSIKKEEEQGKTVYFLSCGIYGQIELLTLMYEEY
ncbi:DUF4362 domain-containing protein [Halobacillus mangrovi]|uniref:DUF4362 domain-containing protein n=1 Tax=Halobacillus mangrovi TaxID=402384 RepID=A0A1W6A0K8_9BACI|nr:DUF4362 domain-containing protein [Halobacillus mangrovi]ARI79024.1 hypothetical protein HM131_20300 [Halobacillus mangrovi]